MLLASDGAPAARAAVTSVMLALSAWYLCADRFPLGKRLLQLRVVDSKTGARCTLGQSVTRNLPFAVRSVVRGVVALTFGPWDAFQKSHAFAALVLGGLPLAVALFEARCVDTGAPRLGDRWAGTAVVDLRPRVAAPPQGTGA